MGEAGENEPGVVAGEEHLCVEMGGEGEGEGGGVRGTWSRKGRGGVSVKIGSRQDSVEFGVRIFEARHQFQSISRSTPPNLQVLSVISSNSYVRTNPTLEISMYHSLFLNMRIYHFVRNEPQKMGAPPRFSLARHNRSNQDGHLQRSRHHVQSGCQACQASESSFFLTRIPHQGACWTLSSSLFCSQSFRRPFSMSLEFCAL
jgi:hypothetical protein